MPLWGPLTRRVLSRPDPAPVAFDAPAPTARFSVRDAPWWVQTGAAPVTIARRISRVEALQVPAVVRGRNLICGSLAALPLHQYDSERRRVRSPLLEQIDANVPNVVTLAQTIEDLLFEGVSWWRVRRFGWDEFPVHAEHLDVATVSTQPPAGISPQQLPSGAFPRGAVWVDGKPVDAGNVIRFDSPNLPLLEHGARTIRRAAQLEQTAETYASDPRMLGFFTPAEGADPAADEDILAMLDDWSAARRARSTGYVPAALKYNPDPMLTPVELQLADLQMRATVAIADLFGLDPEDFGVSTTSRTYQNAIDRRQDRINETYAPYLRAIEDRLSMGDVTPPGRRVAFDLDAFLRADPRTRAETYQIHKGMGTLTAEEIREEEDRPPLPADAEPAPAPAPAPMPETVQQEAAVGATFTAESVQFDTDATAAQFRVDAGQRVISGLAVPYGPVARSGGRQWRFQQGALKWADVGRVKLLRDHDHSQAVGRAISLDDTPDGLYARFKVARGVDGDKVLALAEDGVLDGLSVGIDFEQDGFTEDPARSGAYLVTRAALREVTLTAMPSFDGARVDSVAASDPERDLTMTDVAPEQTAPAAPAAAPVDLPAHIRDAVAAAFAARAPEGGPTPVNPLRPVVTVREPLPYRFDGLRATHDFSTDLIAMSKGVGDAGERVNRFMSAAFDIDTADVNELNPNRQRPDLFVDNLDFEYPVWSAINKGTLPDSTPFTLPKYSSAATLVSAHVEGVAPTAGTYVTTGQTITPSAVSGRVEITRETWDQGGNPQFSGLLWREVTRAYYENLETSAVDMLDALTPTAIALNGTDSDLDQDVVANLSALAYIRGGNRFRDFVVASNLFAALAGAVDDMGRRLYPLVAPSNASGTTDGFYSQILVGGLAAKPAWALEAGNGGDGSSYLFNREDCHGWATAPQRFEFQYRVEYVDVAVFGYKALANTRLGGVREVTYSAV